MNVHAIILLVGYGHGRVKLTAQERAMLPYIWLAFIIVVAGSVYLTYRSWKKQKK